MNQEAIKASLLEIQQFALQMHKDETLHQLMRASIEYELNKILDAVNPRHERKTRDCIQASLRELMSQAMENAPERIVELYPVFALFCGTSRNVFPHIEWL